MDGLALALFAARSADDKKGEDVVIYDLRGLSDVADYFVVATAQSRMQARAIVGAIEKGLKDQGVFKFGQDGSSVTNQWILLDYADCVIHVFSQPMREFYSLESLWGDAPKVEWRAANSEPSALYTTPAPA